MGTKLSRRSTWFRARWPWVFSISQAPVKISAPPNSAVQVARVRLLRYASQPPPAVSSKA